MKTLEMTIGKIQLAQNNQSERERVFIRFPYLFENNETIKKTAINIQLKPRHYLIKQKARSVPLHLQEDVGRESKKLILTGHRENKLCRRRLFHISGGDNGEN